MYQIGNFVFEIQHEGFTLPANMEKFKTDGDKADYWYHIKITDEIKVEDSQFLVQKASIKIARTGDFETRYLYFSGEKRPYAVSRELDRSHAQIMVARDALNLLQSDPGFVSLLSLEKRMQTCDSYILHSVYMQYGSQAILFTAPSGGGKTTQAELWEKYRGTHQINGDRTLIKKQGSQYYAYGWPVCGSSGICYNKSLPICAIVILNQGKVNMIEPMSYKQTVLKILKEITVNYHDECFFNSAISFINELIRSVPVYHLVCDISEKAVICLEEKLLEQNP